MKENMLLMNLTERHSVCIRSNCNGFWWRLFTLEYSRNIWCELAVIVGFRETTVCLWGENRGFRWKRDVQKVLRNSQTAPQLPPLWRFVSLSVVFYKQNKSTVIFFFKASRLLQDFKMMLIFRASELFCKSRKFIYCNININYTENYIQFFRHFICILYAQYAVICLCN